MLRRDSDFTALQQILLQAHQREPLPILAYCLMGNHWHFLLRPSNEGQISRVFRFPHPHPRPPLARRPPQRRLWPSLLRPLQSLPGQPLLEVLRYVERNALAAKLVEHAQDWPWSSLWAREHAHPELTALLHPWPTGRPANWLTYVNQPLSAQELTRLTISENRSRPYGQDAWVRQVVGKLGLQHTIRSEGRPSSLNQST